MDECVVRGYAYVSSIRLKPPLSNGEARDVRARVLWPSTTAFCDFSCRSSFVTCVHISNTPDSMPRDFVREIKLLEASKVALTEEMGSLREQCQDAATKNVA